VALALLDHVRHCAALVVALDFLAGGVGSFDEPDSTISDHSMHRTGGNIGGQRFHNFKFMPVATVITKSANTNLAVSETRRERQVQWQFSLGQMIAGLLSIF
jgi:hypothetical protein